MSDESLHVAAGPELTTQQLHDLLRLRVDIFVVEQDCPYPEIDGRDLAPDTTHLWLDGAQATAYRNGAEHDGGVTADRAGHVPVAAAIRILTDETEKRIGRVVTHVDHRGVGLSSRLMEAALALVGSHRIVLDAQAHLTEFYARFGFEADGPEFLEDGIPHVTMRRQPADDVSPTEEVTS